MAIFNPPALTELRRIRELTKSELADAADKSRPYITQLEASDRKSPSIEALRDLADALDVKDIRVFFVEPTVDELLEELAAARARESSTKRAAS